MNGKWIQRIGGQVVDEQANPQLVGDGAGGAIIVWQDNRTASHLNIMAQRIDASGNVLVVAMNSRADDDGRAMGGAA